MEPQRVSIVYRPLRIGWAIRGDDFPAFRKAVQMSYALWGGRFNPIIRIDNPAEADALIEHFRVDVIEPIGEGDDFTQFLARYKHIITPYHFHRIFHKARNQHDRNICGALDVHNALVHFREGPQWKQLADLELKTFAWSADDPLRDVFLVQFGQYPDPEDIGTDYLDLVRQSTVTRHEITIPSGQPIPTADLTKAAIPTLSRLRVERHYSLESGVRWDEGGYFVGDSARLPDLTTFWNLRACDVPLWFVDRAHIGRYANLLPVWGEAMRNLSARRAHGPKGVSVWSWEGHNFRNPAEVFGPGPYIICTLRDDMWEGRTDRAPMMHFGEASTLGAWAERNDKSRSLTFPLSDKPFANNIHFHTQLLVASLQFSYRTDAEYVLIPPYVPELNEFYAREMHFNYDRLRIEPERIGLIIDAADTDAFVYRLRVDDLVKRIFDLAGFKAEFSAAGLIAKQIITNLGGVQGGRAFKIAGVRRLIRTFGPNDSFTKRTAINMICSRDPDLPGGSFADHKDLFIEYRPQGKELTGNDVLGFLVEKKLFRLGSDVPCTNCRMTSWVSLDALKAIHTCDLCGHTAEITRQLSNNDAWAYRRSGILGAERNALGAVPVVLTLQQLDSCFHGDHGIHTLSMVLRLNPDPARPQPADQQMETDFVWIQRHPRDIPAFVISEVKGQGVITDDDVTNLRTLANAIPRKRFKTFVVFTKLTPFTPDELARVRTLNHPHDPRVILLTADELEPYWMYKRRWEQLGEEVHAVSLEVMARTTERLFFA